MVNNAEYFIRGKHIIDYKDLPHSFRNETNARITGIPDATQKRYDTWQEAHDAYADAYKQGIIRATPIADGPFDPYADGYEAELASALSRLEVV